MLQEADTDDHQGTLGFEEFCAFYKMMSTRRDLYLLMLTYSNHKGPLDANDLQRFLEVEQKVRAPPRDGAWPVRPHLRRLGQWSPFTVWLRAWGRWAQPGTQGPHARLRFLDLIQPLSQASPVCFRVCPTRPLSGWGSLWFLL